eukprot:gene11716-14341_t
MSSIDNRNLESDLLATTATMESSSNSKKDQQINELVTKFVVSQKLSSEIVENPHFQELIALAGGQSKTVVVNKEKTQELIEGTLKSTIVSEIKNELGLDDSLMFSIAYKVYPKNNRIGMVIYFVNSKFEQKEFPINFDQLSDSNSIKVAHSISNTLKDYDIPPKKIISLIGGDNFSFNEDVVKVFNSINEVKVHQGRSVAHCVEVFVEEFLKISEMNQSELFEEFEEYIIKELDIDVFKYQKIPPHYKLIQRRLDLVPVKNTVHRLRKIILKFHLNPIQLNRFVPSFDLSSSWISTEKMISETLKNKMELEKSTPFESFTTKDWEELEIINHILQVFKTFIQTSLTCTDGGKLSSDFPNYYRLFNSIQDLITKYSKYVDAFEGAKKKLKQYYDTTNSQDYYLSVILNPLLEQKYFESSMWKEIAVSVYKNLENQFNQMVGVESEGRFALLNSTLTTELKLFDTFYKKIQTRDSKMEKYFESTLALYKDNEISYLFPNICKLAKQYLSIPNSNSGVDRLFSPNDLLTVKDIFFNSIK